MKILVCGGRSFPGEFYLRRALDTLHAERPVTHLIEGGAEGADTFARRWANDHSIKTTCYPANWELYGVTAGAIRNEWMLRHGRPALVYAFPPYDMLGKMSRGTRNMVNLARRAGVETIVFGEGS